MRPISELPFNIITMEQTRSEIFLADQIHLFPKVVVGRPGLPLPMSPMVAGLLENFTATIELGKEKLQLQ